MDYRRPLWKHRGYYMDPFFHSLPKVNSRDMLATFDSLIGTLLQNLDFKAKAPYYQKRRRHTLKG